MNSIGQVILKSDLPEQSVLSISLEAFENGLYILNLISNYIDVLGR